VTATAASAEPVRSEVESASTRPAGPGQPGLAGPVAAPVGKGQGRELEQVTEDVQRHQGHPGDEAQLVCEDQRLAGRAGEQKRNACAEEREGGEDDARGEETQRRGRWAVADIRRIGA
jgi:hypothetical protein